MFSVPAKKENRPTQTQIPKNNNIAQYGRAVTEHSDVPETQSAASATSVSPGHSMPERFVGDLNPEAVIREKLDGKSVNPLRDKIGLWISSPIVQSDNEGRGNFSSVESPPAVQSSQPIPSILHQRYTSAMKACDRLPPQTLEKLIPIYFSKVNHILPLIDKNSFLRAQSKGTSTFLERAMCLVAAKYKRTSFDLQLVSGEPIVTSRRFCSDIYNGLVAAMDARLEVDRVARIRILALMSLHCEGYDGAEAASMHLCQAIHLAQTAGLHLDRPGRAAEDSLSTLFWCLWTLDKMHASLCGRPILLADRDIGIEKPNVNSCKSRSAFDVWLAISDLLATVISFYRPSASDTMGWEEDFPTFEEIVGDSIQGDLDFTTLGAFSTRSNGEKEALTNPKPGLLEVYYHAVSILSCRSVSSDHLKGSRPSYIRRGLAAIRIHSIVALECSLDLPPLPILPYSLALSMGVSYQQFRSSKLITHLNRTKTSLANCCALLEELSDYWFSAEAMARLGRTALHQMEGKLEYLSHPEENWLRDTSGGVNATGSLTEINATGESREDYGPSRGTPSVAGLEDNHDPLRISEPVTDSGDPGYDRFANIDMLFGDFLDLSLPTNFWDPVFSTEEPGEMQTQ
ncbi:fungal specific transcription factor [Aspergillus sclerotialis]|uniref:Fungal specific transcription factor n=1 Tax=Aspergillus sclerotialis TaxID=2070753 RepID=A0A3A2ZGH8_9EURO|nr:fungal specific transcription factor [Aspergillus sclerotialis]